MADRHFWSGKTRGKDSEALWKKVVISSERLSELHRLGIPCIFLNARRCQRYVNAPTSLV